MKGKNIDLKLRQLVHINLRTSTPFPGSHIICKPLNLKALGEIISLKITLNIDRFFRFLSETHSVNTIFFDLVTIQLINLGLC